MSPSKWRGVIALVISAGILMASQGLAADTVKIVHIDPFSGPFKDLGDRHYMGVQFAVDEINSQGGLLGKKVELFAEDSQLKPDIAARKALKAVMQDGATVIMQNISTAVAQAIMNVAEKNKIVQVSHATYSDSLTGKDFNRIFFRTCYTTGQFARAFAEYFKTQPYRKFYLINMDYVFGHAVADDFIAAMKRVIPDVQIVGNDFHPIATKDFAPYISKVIASGAEVVYTGNYGTDLETLMKHAAQLGMKARWASNQLDDPVVLSNIREYAVGAIAVTLYSPGVETPKNKIFMEKWHSKFKDTKNPWPAGASFGQVYNGCMFFFEAVKKAQSIDPEAVIKAWEGMEYEGVMGKMTMRACDHQTLQPLIISEIEAKSAFYPFPFLGKPVMVPAERIAIPPNETGNPRCK
jgi:branched-chain amino acid transport system substrate-binding protein